MVRASELPSSKLAICHFNFTSTRVTSPSPSYIHVCPLALGSYIACCKQDPEGILSTPQGGHISRRFLAKEVEKNKELQAEVEKLKKEKNEELQQQRDVSRESPVTTLSELAVPPLTQRRFASAFDRTAHTQV